MTTTTSPPPGRLGGPHLAPVSRTAVRGEQPPDGPPPVRRALSRTTAEARLVQLWSWSAGVSLGWLVSQRIMPWTGLTPLVLASFVCGLLVLGVATALTGTATEVRDRLASAVIHAGAALVGLALASTVVFIFARGARALPHLNMYVDDMSGVGPRAPFTRGGVLHAIVGSIVQIGIAVAVTVPLGIGTAVFMTEVGGRFGRIVRTVVDAMTALPSIVAGLFIYTTLIVGLGLHRSGLAASMALAVMMLPIIARASDVTLRVVPGSLREASLALGASRWRTVWHVVLPAARPGLATALILGVARGIGETSPVLLTSGAASFVVADPVHGVMNSLPLFIFSTVRSGEPIYIARAFGAAAILLTLVLALFVTARLLARPRRTTRRRAVRLRRSTPSVSQEN